MLWYTQYTMLTNVIAFVLGIFLYKKFPSEIKVIYYFVILGVITEIYNKIHIHFIMKNSMPVGHFYFPIVIIILGIFYIRLLKGFIKPKWIVAIISVYIIYSIINTAFIQGLFQYASVTAALGSLILFLFSISYFIKVMVEAKIKTLRTSPLIWINTAVLIYYSVSFFYHSFYNILYKSSLDAMYVAVNVFSLFNLLFYLIIIVGFILSAREVPKTISENKKLH